jgi:hypothetical protein
MVASEPAVGGEWNDPCEHPKMEAAGMSTLVAALIFWKAVTPPCIIATLMSKSYKSTKSLFDKIKRFTDERLIHKNIVVET